VIPIPAIAVFLLAALALLYIVTRSVAHGRRAGMASVAGIEIATLCHSAAAALGLSAILLVSSLAFNLVKYLGAAYLLYLGIRSILSRQDPSDRAAFPEESLPQHFRKGLLVNLLNPKTALFFYAFLPQFVDPARGSSVLQVLTLSLLFVCLATVTDSAYALLASGAGRALARSPRFRRVQRYLTGGIYISLGIAAAISGSGRQ
jgi:threonine/homoserine/homoserine lactone efflux protein